MLPFSWRGWVGVQPHAREGCRGRKGFGSREKFWEQRWARKSFDGRGVNQANRFTATYPLSSFSPEHHKDNLTLEFIAWLESWTTSQTV